MKVKMYKAVDALDNHESRMINPVFGLGE